MLALGVDHKFTSPSFLGGPVPGSGMDRPVMRREHLQGRVLLLPQIKHQPPLAMAGQGLSEGKGWSMEASRMFPVPQTSPVAGLGMAGGWLGQAGQCYSQSQLPELLM